VKQAADSGQATAVSIVGVGLIGGSFALALRKAGFPGRIIGVSSPRTIERAFQLGVIDEALPLEDAAAQSDVIYLAQPIAGILDTLDRLTALAPSTLITDAGSTKYAIMQRAKSLPNFIGGHPMAGKESRGVEHADPDLFRGRPYVLTEPEPWLMNWVERIGARPVILAPEEHDRLVALVSHLPQLISTALACELGAEPRAASVVGPGALDMTRLAASPYDIWRDIFATNAESIDAALGNFIARLEQVRTRLRAGDLETEFAIAAEAAKRLRRH
jgi:prephenate dehydrogenase